MRRSSFHPYAAHTAVPFESTVPTLATHSRLAVPWVTEVVC